MIYESPEMVVKRMASQTENIKSYTYSGELKIEAVDPHLPKHSVLETIFKKKETQNQKAVVKMGFSGSSDLADLTKPKGNISFHFNLLTPDYHSYSLDFEVTVLESVVYLKLKDFPNILPIDLKPVIGQWISVDMEALQKQPFFKNKNENMDASPWKTKLSKEQGKKCQDIFYKHLHELVQFIRFPDDVLEGVKTYHYKFMIYPKKWQGFLEEVDKILQESKEDSKKLERAKKGLHMITSMDGQIWIGKKDKRLYRLDTHMAFKDESKSDETVSMALSFLVKNYNQPVVILPPIAPKKIEKVIEEIKERWHKEREEQMRRLRSSSPKPLLAKEWNSMSSSSQLVYILSQMKKMREKGIFFGKAANTYQSMIDLVIKKNAGNSNMDVDAVFKGLVYYSEPHSRETLVREYGQPENGAGF